jgi:hypothetical protein
MNAKDAAGLFEAYQQIYTSQELPEEVEIAASYFYEMGLNEDGVNLLIEELGDEEFAEFVYEIVEEYELTEETRLQRGGVKLKGPKGSKPQSTTKAREKAQGATTMKADAAPASTISPRKVAAAKKAKEKQPERKGSLGAIRDRVSAGMKRHNKAVADTKETLGKAGSAAKKVLGGFASGVSGVAKLAGHLASKGLKEEQILEYLMTEGYADTEQAAQVILNNMSEEWLEDIAEGMTMKDFKQQRSRQKQKEKRAADKIAPNRRAGIHHPSASPERAARHRANVDPDFEGNDERNYPGGNLKPNKVRKAKALGELDKS